LKSNSRRERKPRISKRGKVSALLVGLGLDGKDGHVRMTKGPNFTLMGGSNDTHELMQETALKFNEELGKRGKRLEEVEPSEFAHIMHKVTPGRKE